MKFDKALINPPYHIGGEIWDKVRKVSENIVCLMPLSKYKAKYRIQYVNFDKFTLSDGRLFEGATITDNLCITVSTSLKSNKTY